MNHDSLTRSWTDLLAVWKVDTAAAVEWFADIRRRYSEPMRFYHDLVHIEQVLSTVERLGSHAVDINAVKLAAWLHDVVYDSKASDNEERSADYAAPTTRDDSAHRCRFPRAGAPLR